MLISSEDVKGALLARKQVSTIQVEFKARWRYILVITRDSVYIYLIKSTSILPFHMTMGNRNARC